MDFPYGRSRRERRIPRLALALPAALALAGCASLPEEAYAPAAPRVAASAETFQGPQGAWPGDPWWTAYGDPQLDALVAQALAGAPDLRIADARLRQAEAIQQGARALNRPQVDLNASADQQKLSYNYLTPPAFTPQGWNDYGRVTLDLGWQLDFWGRNRAAIAAAASGTEAARAELAQARLSLAAAVTSAYAELAHLHELHDVAAQWVKVRGETAGLFARRQANGLENLGGVRSAEAARANAELALQQLDEAIGLQRHLIAALLGEGPDAGARISRPRLGFEAEVGLPAQLALDLLGRRPDIVAARWRAEAAARNADAKQAAFYPNVNLMAFIGTQSLGLNMLADGGSKVGGVGPALSLPLFSGGRLRSDLRAARAGHDEAIAAYDRTVAHALQDVADAALGRRSIEAQLASSVRATDAAAEAHRVARNRYQGGLASYLEVLVAEDALLANQRTLADLRARALGYDIALNLALGGGYRAAPADASKGT